MARFIRLAALCMLLGVIALSSAWAVGITGVGQVTINANGFSGVSELSGITYAGTVSPGVHCYYVVSDNAAGEGATPRVYGMNVTYNTATGAVTSATIVSQHNLSTGYDTEGIAYNTSTGAVYVSDENSTNPQIREYDLSTGAATNTLSVPSVFQNARDNKGFESLTRQWGGESLWTANEEALTVDGNISTTSAGTTVRLQKYDSNLNPAGEWAYITQVIEDDWPSDSRELSGVSDLVALPDGTVLVLEREVDADLFVSGFQDFRN
ncbi:MAG: esterase-like activity of phytase family protein, partial [Armatimonadota bacterium]